MVLTTHTGCGPCKQMSALIAQLTKEGFAGRVVFVKIDVDAAPALAKKHGVDGLPTIHFYVGGKKVRQMVGVSESKIRSAINGLVVA